MAHAHGWPLAIDMVSRYANAHITANPPTAAPAPNCINSSSGSCNNTLATEERIVAVKAMRSRMHQSQRRRRAARAKQMIAEVYIHAAVPSGAHTAPTFECKHGSGMAAK